MEDTQHGENFKRNAKKRLKRKLKENGVTEPVTMNAEAGPPPLLEYEFTKQKGAETTSGLASHIPLKAQQVSSSSWLNIVGSIAEWAPITVCRRAYKIVAPLIGAEKLLGVLALECAAAITFNQYAVKYGINLSDNKREMDTLLSRSEPGTGFTDEMASLIIGGIAPIVSTVAIYAITEVATRLAERSIKYPSLDKQLENHYSTDNGRPYYLMMSSLKDASIIPTIPKDLGAAVRGANYIFVSTCVALYNAVEATRYVYNASDISQGYTSPQNILGYKFAIAGAIGLVSLGISYLYEQANKEVTPYRVAAQAIENHYNRFPVETALSRGEVFAPGRIQDAVDQIRPAENKTTFLETAMKVWHESSKKSNKLLDYGLTIYRVATVAGTTVKDSALMLMHLEHLSLFLNLATENAKPIAEALAAIGRLEKYKKMEEVCLKKEFDLTRSFIDDGEVIKFIKGLKMSSEDRNTGERVLKLELQSDILFPLRTIKNEEEQPARIMVIGPSGVGKTTMLKAIGGVDPSSGIELKGTMELPRNIKVFSVPQHTVFPPNSSFLELLCFPDIPYSAEREEEMQFKSNKKAKVMLSVDATNKIVNEALAIVKKLDMEPLFHDHFINLEVKRENWDSLSGGMRKVLGGYIPAIIQQPDVVIFDETRGAIDPVRVPLLEDLLKEKLPKTTTIEICHPEIKVNPRTHNYFTEVIDLRSHAVNLPPEQENSLFSRMSPATIIGETSFTWVGRTPPRASGGSFASVGNLLGVFKPTPFPPISEEQSFRKREEERRMSSSAQSFVGREKERDNRNDQLTLVKRVESMAI